MQLRLQMLERGYYAVKVAVSSFLTSDLYTSDQIQLYEIEWKKCAYAYDLKENYIFVDMGCITDEIWLL